jgi:hypothetical protein
VLGNRKMPGGTEIFQLFARVDQGGAWAELIVPSLICEAVTVTTLDDGMITDVTVDPDQTGACTAIRLRSGDEPPVFLRQFNIASYRVLLRADMIRDEKGDFAVDGNHIFGAVPQRRSGNGVQGGSFESWFGIAQ